MADAPADWTLRVNRATSLAELDALYREAWAGGFADRSRYLLVKRNQATIRTLEKTLVRTAEKALAPLTGLNQAGAATLLRGTVPGLVETFGNANAVAAIDYYNAQRDIATGTSAFREQYARGGRNKAAARRAQAQLRSYVAKIPKIDNVKTVDSIIGYGMKTFMGQGAKFTINGVSNAMTRATAAYNRDTILYNSALDPAVVGVQRVAEADACAFCAMVAFDQYGDARVSGYAADYHNNCRCSIETLYAGDKAYKPDYYDDFPYSPDSPTLDDFATAREEFNLA
jgi:hypothetical protein